ncbi:maleylpyruvate isomerase N-terminal domain-containing protein [Gordonia sp. IITR100]|uniref:maleylpyruvate isomerase N-terminal domain-containing protein n=1 Tax=unclassified Gordonia (in: high G+C Gram-positive bacteria) TaxID=2657482 RepID=UPI001595C5B0
MTPTSPTIGSEAPGALLAARRGTALFSRALQELTDPALDEPSTTKGRSRRDVVAYTGYHARRMSALVARARSSSAGLRWEPPTTAEVDYGATLSASALRNLHEHSVAHLNVEWRDLDPRAWRRPVDSAVGPLTLVELVWDRAHTVWFGAAHLRIHFDERVIPDEVRLRLTSEARDRLAAQGGQGIQLPAVRARAGAHR